MENLFTVLQLLSKKFNLHIPYPSWPLSSLTTKFSDLIKRLLKTAFSNPASAGNFIDSLFFFLDKNNIFHASFTKSQTTLFLSPTHSHSRLHSQFLCVYIYVFHSSYSMCNSWKVISFSVPAETLQACKIKLLWGNNYKMNTVFLFDTVNVGHAVNKLNSTWSGLKCIFSI